MPKDAKAAYMVFFNTNIFEPFLELFMQKGIIVGLNATLEYLLPFFYTNLRLHSDLPITFFDYGMSAFGRNFCEKRGEIIEISNSLYTTQNHNQNHQIKQAWFKKPLSCQIAPYDFNLWIDLDILIRAPFEDIFHKLEGIKEITICQEYLVKIKKTPRQYKQCPIYDSSVIKTLENLKKTKNSYSKIPDTIPIYNSGFFAFKKNAQFITPWIELSKKLANSLDGLRIGDQDALSFTLFDMSHIIATIPITYNYVIQTPKNVGKQHPLDTKLSLIRNLRCHHLDIYDAHNIHFAAKTKINLLARYLEFEKLCHHQVSHKEHFHVS